MQEREPLKIWSYGDSLSQPREKIVKDSQRYLTLILTWFCKNWAVNTRLYEHSRGNSTVKSLYDWYCNDMSYFKNENKDILIIHCGICDCAPRIVLPKLRSCINKLPNKVKNVVIEEIKKNRKRVQKKGIYWRRVKPKEFSKILEEWLLSAMGEFKRIYVFNIAPTNDRIEEHSPGLRASINIYNNLIFNVINSIKAQNICLIDIHEKILDESNGMNNIDEYITEEDGHHITIKTHQLCFNAIMENEQKYMG